MNRHYIGDIMRCLDMMRHFRFRLLLWILPTAVLVTFIDCSCSFSPVRFHLLPWSMSKCDKTISIGTTADCAIACSSDARCAGANLDTGNSLAVCTLCFELETVTSSAESKGFLFPYTHRVDLPARAISIPCMMRPGFAIFFSAVLRGGIGLYLHEQKCDSSYGNCAVDFFLTVRFDESAGNTIILNKMTYGVWGTEVRVTNNGAFVIGQRSQVLLLIWSSVYAVVVNGKEIVRYPKGPIDISESVRVTAYIGSPQSISFYSPDFC